MIKAPWLIVPLALSLGAVACHAPRPMNQEVAAQVPAIRGQVTDLRGARATQAQTTDIANGATVSLIDTATGVTVATTVTAANGSFTLNFGSEFKPVIGKPYYMEAVKGLPVGGVPNRAGAAIARVRTILFYNWNGWSSLSGGVGFPVSIGKATTTVAAIVSLKGFSTASQSALVGTVSGLNFTDPSHTIDATDFSTVFSLVDAAVTADQDPLEAIGFDSSFALPGSQYAKKAGNLVIHDNYTVNGAPSPATASLNAPYNTITFYGQNFPSTASVTIGPVPVATWSVNAARTQLTATLTANGYSGGLQITQGTSTWTGPFVPVSGTVGTLAGSGYAANIDGMGQTAGFAGVGALTIDSSNNAYVLDGINIRKVQPGGRVTTIASGTSAYGIQGLCIDNQGNLYAACRATHQIITITPAGAISVLAGSGTDGYLDGPAATAKFSQPTDVSVDSNGNIYVVDLGNRRIRKITPAGSVSTFAGTGAAGWTDGATSSATFYTPYGMTIDTSGNLYVGDWANFGVRKITPGGVVSTLAGGSTGGYLDGTGAAAQFKNLKGVSADAAGNIFVVDVNNDRIRKITPAGVVTTICGSGARGFLNGSAGTAQLNYSHYVAVGPNGHVYFTDYSRQVRVFVP